MKNNIIIDTQVAEEDSRLIAPAEAYKTLVANLTAQSSYLARNIIAESLRTSLLEFGNVLNECHRVSISNVAASMAETLNAVTKDIVSEQIKQFQQIDFSAIFEAINPEVFSLNLIYNKKLECLL